MKKSEVIIVEDEAIVAKDIEVCLIKDGFNILKTFAKGETALDFLEKKRVDLVIMDISLAGELSGIDAAHIIKEKYNIPIIFLTAYADEKTIESAKITEPYGYVVKPFKEQELKIAIEMALYKHKVERKRMAEIINIKTKTPSKNTLDFIYVKSNSKLIKIHNSNIYFVEALKDYVIIHTKDEKFTIHSTMKNIEDKLYTETFIRIHRSFIVNVEKIKNIENNHVILEDLDKKIPIGGSHRESLFNILTVA